MNSKEKNKKNNTTSSSEFVPSYFTWQTLSGQKKRAKELNNMTKKESK